MVLINLTTEALTFWFIRRRGEALPLLFDRALPYLLEEERARWGWQGLQLPAGHSALGAGTWDNPQAEPRILSGPRQMWPEENDPHVYALPGGRFVEVRTQEPRTDGEPQRYLRAFELRPDQPALPLRELPAEILLPTRPARAGEALPAEALGIDEPLYTYVKATFTTYSHREEVTLEMPLDFYSMPQIQQEVLLDEEYDAWLLGGRTTYTIHEPQAAA